MIRLNHYSTIREKRIGAQTQECRIVEPLWEGECIPQALECLRVARDIMGASDHWSEYRAAVDKAIEKLK